MIEVFSMDYVKTAASKGLSPRKVILKHCLKNALFPVITYIGTLTANIITGSFIIEKIFGIPGLGQWYINSVNSRDYTVISGLNIFFSAIFLFCIFFVDILYGILDPRIKWGKTAHVR
jgi:ABC-type dipeptide/oligopeptide/nickel transport system permease component